MEENLSLYYQRTNKIKKILVIVFTFFVLALGGLLGFLYCQSVSYDVSESITLEINVDKRIKDILVNVQHGKIKNGQDYFETESLGEKTINVEFENYLGKQETKTLSYKVVDSVAPVVENELSFVFVYQNDSLEQLISKIIVSDNSKGTINKTIDGDYDLASIGTYGLTFKCSDETGNETVWPFKLIVEQHFSNESDAYTTFTTENNYVGITKNGVTYVDGYLIANKTYSVPAELNAGMSSYVQKQFDAMKQAAKKDGCNIIIVSGYRSYQKQNSIYTNWYKTQGQTRADTHSARPGYSEHQTGLAVDINKNNSSFASTKEFTWLQQNCYKYGFILRYVKNKSDQTGYTYESWHYRYVGKELAEIIYNNGDWLTLEEYFGITSQYDHDFK